MAKNEIFVALLVLTFSSCVFNKEDKLEEYCANHPTEKECSDSGLDLAVDVRKDAFVDTMQQDASIDTKIYDASNVDIVIDAPAPDVLNPDIAVSLGFVTIQSGTFSMGSSTSESCRDSDETQHQVTLTHDFEISEHEVTQQEFQKAMIYNPSQFSSCGNDCPVETVNWHEAAAYCNELSTQNGYDQCYFCTGSGTSVTCSEDSAYSGANVYNCPGYRLCTEAEWEYAYRAGTISAFYNGGGITLCDGIDSNANAIGWYFQNSNSTTHPVGQKQANAWGLYDMAGNVWEWCHDWYGSYGSSAVTDPWGASSGTARVLRGGSWGILASDLRAARRSSGSPSDLSSHVGFRCCRTRN